MKVSTLIRSKWIMLSKIINSIWRWTVKCLNITITYNYINSSWDPRQWVEAKICILLNSTWWISIHHTSNNFNTIITIWVIISNIKVVTRATGNLSNTLTLISSKICRVELTTIKENKISNINNDMIDFMHMFRNTNEM